MLPPDEPARIASPARRAEWVQGIALRVHPNDPRARECFEQLFADFAPRVKTYLLRLGSDSTQADELAQETLLIVWRKAALFDPARASVSTWVFTIARNLRIDAIRRMRSPGDFAWDMQEALTPSSEKPPQEQMLEAESHAHLRDALTSLSTEQADVVRLSFFEDRPHGEIASVLGIPLGTVKSRLRLALVRLRGALDGAP